MEGTSRSGSRMNRFRAGKSVMVNGSDDSRSESDNFEVGEEQDLNLIDVDGASGSNSNKRKKYNRHTPFQIQELDSYFKVFPHPDEKQRIDLGNRLGLDCKQVKFWFQNKRTQLKTQLERHENALLKEEFDKLRMEHQALKEYFHKPICKDCGGESPPIIMDEHQARLENAQLKKELIRVCGIAESLIGKPISDLITSVNPNLTALEKEIDIPPQPLRGIVAVGEYEKSFYLQVATVAVDELIALARNDPAYWKRNFDGGMESLNHQVYVRKYNPYEADLPNLNHEATRESCTVTTNCMDLVNILMHPGRWASVFSSMVRKVKPISVLFNGIGGTQDGALILVEAELFFPSPFVPVRHMRFMRFCKNYGVGSWAIVDISIDSLRDGYEDITRRCKKLPSGFCITQESVNACSSVTCIEHVEYDESVIHSLFRPLVQSGYAFGAQRWLATLERQCEYATYLPRSAITPFESSIGITPEGRKCILKLTRRMVDKFYEGICVTSDSKWEVLNLGDIAPNFQVMTRVSIDELGEPSGIILSFSTSLWMPVPRKTLFDFLRNGQHRGHWDVLADGGPMEEAVQIPKGNGSTNSITILCPPENLSNGIPCLSNKDNLNKMGVLQETWADRASSVVVYSAADIAAITHVMEGGNPDFVLLLPSGFAIFDAFAQPVSGQRLSDQSPTSLLTLGFQILMNTSPMYTLNIESIQTVKDLMTQTIAKIKGALGCE